MDRIEYDEFGLFHENASEYGLRYDAPPQVRRQFVEVEPDRRLSAIVWGDEEPDIVLLHGGSQNAHTWDTVALALGRPLVALDLPGHGHSDGLGEPRPGQPTVERNAEDVAIAIRELAAGAQAVVGMSLGGLTTIALTKVAPELVRKVVLVDVTPGVTPGKAKQITDFVNGPPTFSNFDELLQRTIQFNPTRTVASLRRGILHNAIRREDGTWIWRWARWRQGSRPEAPSDGGGQPTPAAAPAAAAAEGANSPMFGDLWDTVSAIKVPILLARGMLPQSVIGDEDEAELLRRQPDAKVVQFAHAGHSIQGDMPVELAREIEAFVLG